MIYRGYSPEFKKWIEGNLLHEGKSFGREEIFAISESGIWGVNDFSKPLSSYFVEVVPETVGKFTGLVDNNNMELFEGDKINIKIEDQIVECIIKCQLTNYPEG